MSLKSIKGICCFFLLLTIGFGNIPVQAEEHECDFVLEKSIPGIHNLAGFCVSPDNKNLCVYAHDRIIIYDLSNYFVKVEKKFPDRYFRDGYWGEDSLVFSSYPKSSEPPFPGSITVISPSNLSMISEHSPTSEPMIMIKPSSTGKYLAGASRNDIWIMDVESNFSIVYNSSNHTDYVDAIAWSPKSDLLASAGYNIIIHDVLNRTDRELSVPNANSRVLIWAKNGNYLYNLDPTGPLSFINLSTGEVEKSIGIPHGTRCGDKHYPYNSICIGSGSLLQIISMDPIKYVAEFPDATDRLLHVVWTTDGYRIITSAQDRVLRIYVDRNHQYYNYPPEIRIFRPIDGDIVNGSFLAEGTITDDVRVIFSTYKLNDNDWKFLENPSDWSFEILSSDLLLGVNELVIKASDGDKESIASVSFVYDPKAIMNYPPTVEIETPQNGSRIRELISVSGAASDDIDVESVYVRIDYGDWVKAIGTISWNYTVQLPSILEGWIVIQAKAFDGTLTSRYDTVRVLINRTVTPGNLQPQIFIESPSEGESAVAEILCQGRIEDDSEMVTSYISFDGTKWRGISTSRQWQYKVSVFEFKQGQHTIAFMANDGELSSDIIYVNITKMKYLPPVVQILSPSPNEGFTDNITFSWTVQGGYGEIDRVEIRINGGEWFLAGQNREWSYDYHVVDASLGPITFEARASDRFSYSELANVTAILYSSLRVSIEYPEPNQTFTNSLFVSGIVQYGYGDIQVVELRVNEGEWILTNGTRNWHLMVPEENLTKGAIQIEVRAYDGLGNFDIARISVFHEPVELTPPEDYSSFFIIIIILLVVAIILTLYFKMK